jgi:hypothetical protein
MNPPARAPFAWASYHIFYHERIDRVLLRLVLPLVRELGRQRKIASFFFLRYGLGGPHVRLRLLCAPRHRKSIDDALQRHAAEFFERYPSTMPRSEDEIRQRNRFFLDHDTAGGIDSVYPDNSVIELPFHPEVERYGGAELLEHSLRFFCLSSAYVLRQVERHPEAAKPHLLGLALRALLGQALGFAINREELSRLVTYADGQGESVLAQRANQELERDREGYLRLLREEVESAGDPEALESITESMLTDAARLLRRRIRGASGPVQWQILGSQLHMTANRMGLLRAEEIYVGRILRSILQHASESDAALRSSLEDLVSNSRLHWKGGLKNMASAALRQLVQPLELEAEWRSDER